MVLAASAWSLVALFYGLLAAGRVLEEVFGQDGD